MANSDPAKTYKVEDFIDMQENDSFTYATMALYMQSIIDKTVVYSSDNVLYNYLDENNIPNDAWIVYCFDC